MIVEMLRELLDDRRLARRLELQSGQPKSDFSFPIHKRKYRVPSAECRVREELKSFYT